MNGHVVYGQALFDAGRYNEAEATFNTALGLDPENLIALRHLGDIARLASDSAKAIQWYTRVLEADPRNGEILGYLEELRAAAPPAAPEPAAEPAAEVADAPVATDPPPAEAPASDRSAAETSAPDRSPAETPRVSAAVATPDRVDANPAEIAARHPGLSTPTPVAPIQPVPSKGPSVPLMDLELDVTPGVEEPPAKAEPVSDATPSVPALGDIEFTDMGTSHDAPAQSLGGLEPTGLDASASADGLELDAGLGWDVPASGEPAGGGDADAPAVGATGAAGAPDAESAEVFVTETMAELYLQQGFRDEALDVYRKLAAQNPDDENLRERVRSLESGGRSSLSLEAVSDEVPEYAPGTDSLIVMKEGEQVAVDESPAAPGEPPTATGEPPAATGEPPAATEEPLAAADDPPAANEGPPADAEAPAAARRPTARMFFAALAQRRPLRPDGTAPAGIAAAPPSALPSARGSGSVDALFPGTPAEGDEAMGAALATAVGQVEAAPTIHGRPTQPAGSDFSLDAVFRGEGPQRGSGVVPRQSQHLKFDQFFATPAAEGEAAAAPPPAPADPESASTDDTRFQSWLKGLKGE